MDWFHHGDMLVVAILARMVIGVGDGRCLGVIHDQACGVRLRIAAMEMMSVADAWE